MNLTSSATGYDLSLLFSMVSEIFFKNRAQIPHKKGNHAGMK